MKKRMGLVQFPVAEKQSEDVFFAKVNSFIEEAKLQNLDMLIFPELASLDVVNFEVPLAPQWEALSTSFAQKYFEVFQNISQQVPFTILAGTTPIQTNDGVVNQGKIYNRGLEILSQNKMYMTPEEDLAWGWTSTSEIQIFDWQGIRTAMLICHDSEFPDISQKLFEADVELLLVPSMTTDVSGLNRVRWCSMARAVEHHMYTLITGTTDAFEGQGEYVGQAAFITPQNPYYPTELQLGPFNKGALVTFELDFALLRRTRAERTLVNPRRDAQLRGFDLKLRNSQKSPTTQQPQNYVDLGNLTPSKIPQELSLI